MSIDREQITHYSILVVNMFINALTLSFKIPQIQKILQKKSVKGLSTVSNFMDFYGILFQGLYGIHKGVSFYIYLEYFSTSIQNITIIFLSWYYAEKTTTKDKLIRLLFCVSTPLIITCALINNGNLIPERIWDFLVLMGLPFMGISRVSQIVKIYREKTVGSVSILSFGFRAMKNFIKPIMIAIDKFNWQLILNQLWLGVFTTAVIIVALIYKKNDEEHLKDKKTS